MATTNTTTKSWGFIDAPAVDVKVYPLDTENYAVKADEPTECILVETTSPADQPSSIRYAIQNVADVYSGSDVDPVNKAASKKGKSVVVGIRNILRVTNDTTGEFVDYPVKCNISFTFPISANLDATDVGKVCSRAAGLIIEPAGAAIINRLMRGSLKPSDI